MPPFEPDSRTLKDVSALLKPAISQALLNEISFRSTDSLTDDVPED